MENIAIVVVAYNRINSIKRVLKSLERAVYDEPIDLIISIDKSDNIEVPAFADNFEWKYGKKIVRKISERMGLRNHILSCGDFLDSYDAIVMLEDDIIVSPDFYFFTKEAVRFYGDDENIAGISLYTHIWNSHAHFPFEPIRTEYDTFFMQYAQSWGQVWMRNQWKAFKEWYNGNQDIFEKKEQGLIPLNVKQWPETSWLKYHIKYCIDKNKYFVYPYISFTTDFTDVGVHNPETNTRFQVPLQFGIKKKFNFCPFGEKALKYDIFYENQTMFRNMFEDCDIDLYGIKQNTGMLKKRFLLTTREQNYKIVKSYALQLRPIELNVLWDVAGNDIFLYDTAAEGHQKVSNNYKIKVWDYFLKERFLMKGEYIPFFINRIRKKINRRKK